MLKYKINIIFICVLGYLMFSCGGLEPTPPEEKTLIKGKIKFVDNRDNWPPIDSIKSLKVVAFKNYPPQDLIGDIMNGLAYFTLDSLPLFQKEIDFQFEITDAPQNLEYIVVAYRYGDIFQWKAAGVYSLENDPKKPTTIFAEKGKQYNIVINVDFKNLPPQPGDW